MIEVVQKLVELRLLDVLFTTNGKEYLTPRQLKREVEDEILAHGGRVNIVELPPVLNVDLPHIERVVEALLREQGGLMLVQGELITDWYLDGLAEEIQQQLEAAGRLTLGDLAVQHNLTTDFVRKLVEPRIGGAIRAQLTGGTLYTPAYVERHAARVRGVMCAVLRPVSLPQIVRDHGFNESLFYEALDALAASGRLPGAAHGRNTYTPAVHSYAQSASVRSFFEQNGYLEYTELGKLDVKEPRAYLEATYPNGVALSSAYLKRELLSAAEAEAEEAVASGSPVELAACFTGPPVGADDVELLLGASAALRALVAGGRARHLGGGLLVPAALLDECVKALAPLVEEQAKDSVRWSTA